MKTQVERRPGLALAALSMALVWGAVAPATCRAAPMYSIGNLEGLVNASGGTYPTQIDPTSSFVVTFNAWDDLRVFASPTPGGDPYAGQVFFAGYSEVINPGQKGFAVGSKLATYYPARPDSSYPGAPAFGPPGSSQSEVRSLASSGSMVGASDSKSMPQFAYTVAQGFVNLNTSNLHPAAAQGSGGLSYYGINSQNDVVGTYAFGNFGKFGLINHAFIAALDPTSPLHGGVDLNSLIPADSGWVLTSATGINDAGQIVGYGIDPSGRYAAYELDGQVPEPSVLVFFGVVGVGMVARAAVRRGHPGGTNSKRPIPLAE